MKKTIIFLHGGPGFKDYLAPYFDELASDFKMVFYDQLQGNDIKIEDLLNQLDLIVDEQNAKPILLGHSWGGVLATEYVLKNEDKLSGLVLMCTGLSSSQWTQYQDELEVLGLEDAPAEKIFLTEDEFNIGKPFLNKVMESFSPKTFDSLAGTYLEGYDLLNQISKVKIPILNIFGSHDLRFSKNVTTKFKEYNSNINNIEISNTGHFPFLSSGARTKLMNSLRKNLM